MAGRARRPFNPDSSPGSNGRIRVPSVVTDPVASLKPWPLAVQVAGEEYEVEPWTAADWLSVLMVEDMDLDDVLETLAPDVADALYQSLLQDQITIEDYVALGTDLITIASGRPWFKALRLIGTMSRSWDVVGAELEKRGVDASRISLGAWLDVALITMLGLMEEKDVTMFVNKLEAPPPGTDPMDQEMSRDDFQALMASQ